ncbi:MAG: CYTH domain-containing protein [Flavobacteriaceae bacterium]|nr:CYTH domain-containing protein [Flavobacteriaceae bacterium]
MENLEIERKFLVNSNAFESESFKKKKIIQGFLSSVPNRTVRVRIKGDKGFITVKGIGNKTGTSRFEWEKEISLKEALNLLKICEPGIIDKTRYNINVGNHLFEVDVFHKINAGLIIAEVELNAENEFFEKPSWLGDEVTGIIKYYNSNLSKNPFNKW